MVVVEVAKAARGDGDVVVKEEEKWGGVEEDEEEDEEKSVGGVKGVVDGIRE